MQQKQQLQATRSYMEQCWPIKNLASRERDGWVRKRERETERVWVRDRKAKRGHESEIDERDREIDESKKLLLGWDIITL